MFRWIRLHAPDGPPQVGLRVQEVRPGDDNWRPGLTRRDVQQAGLEARLPTTVAGVARGVCRAVKGVLGRGEPIRPEGVMVDLCLLYTSPSPRDRQKSRMPSSA